MAFPAGADVFVVSLQRRGRIAEIGANGRYRVVVGGMTIWCRENDLTSPSQGRKRARRERQAAGRLEEARRAAPRHRPCERERHALGSLDLHGLTVPEALDAVAARIDQALRAGLDRVEIIHGISGGRLRAAVRGCLAGIDGVRAVPDPRNAGVTWVYFAEEP